MSKKRSRGSEELLNQALEEYPAAKKLARDRGMYLKRCTNTHYKLVGPALEWSVNLYPTTGKIHVQQGVGPGTIMKLGRGWCLLDAVRAAEVIAEGEQDSGLWAVVYYRPGDYYSGEVYDTTLVEGTEQEVTALAAKWMEEDGIDTDEVAGIFRLSRNVPPEGKA